MEFRDYPMSYRLSQGGMAVAFAMAYSPFANIVNLAPNARIALLALVWTVVAISLCTSFYVIVRYPYLSLVESTDGDHFVKFFATSGSRLYTILKIAALIVVSVLIMALLVNGRNDLQNFLFLAYLIIMFCFLVFLTFIYNPISHPTVATFIRATIGFGVLLFPIFIPALVVGSIRCKRLLDEAPVEE